MALLFIEGFDVYTSGSELSPGKWDLLSGTPSFATGRLGVNKCALFSSNSVYVEKVVSNLGTSYFGIALKLSGAPSAQNFVVGYEGTVPNFYIGLDAGRHITIKDAAGTLQDTGSTVLTVGVWYYVEIKSVISNTGSIEVKLDSAVEASATGIDIQNSGNSYIDTYRLLGNAGGLYFDDCYILDTSGTLNITYLGDSRIDPIFPDGDNSIQWTPLTPGDNYLMVEEEAADGDTSYVYSATPGDIDLYEFEALGVGTGDVYGVQVVANARKMDAGTRSLKLKSVSGVNTQTSSSQALSTSYTNRIAMFESSDGGTTAWNKTLVDAAKFGIEVV